MADKFMTMEELRTMKVQSVLVSTWIDFCLCLMKGQFANLKVM